MALVIFEISVTTDVCMKPGFGYSRLGMTNETVITVLAEAENVVSAPVLVTTVTGKSGFVQTVQAGIIILKALVFPLYLQNVRQLCM